MQQKPALKVCGQPVPTARNVPYTYTIATI